MALNTSRSAAQLARQALQTAHAQPTAAALARPFLASSAPRSFSSTPSPRDDAAALARAPAAAAAAEASEMPRWAQTPKRMKAPFSPHITKDPARSVWRVNDSPEKLDMALSNLLGKSGDRLLPEEIKWLAVTHKSFDQGRRGMNDRLAFLGRQLVTVECVQAILSSQFTVAESAPESLAGETLEQAAAEARMARSIPQDVFKDRRAPFEPESLKKADKLSVLQPYNVLSARKLHKLAVETGIAEVVRWKPRMVS